MLWDKGGGEAVGERDGLGRGHCDNDRDGKNGGDGIDGGKGSLDGGGDERGGNGGGGDMIGHNKDADPMVVDKGAQVAVCIVVRGIVADGSALTYACSIVQFVEYLLADESCLHVLESWFLLSMEDLTESQQRATIRDMILAMNLHEDNCPVVLDFVLFELFSQYLVRKQKRGGGDLSATAFEGCHSALMHMFCHSKYTCSDEFSEKIGDFLCAMQRKVSFFVCF